MTRNRQISGITLSPSASIRHAAGVIQSQEIKFLIVCSAEGQLLGTVTDGDLRRALLQRIDVDASVQTIMNRQPKVARGNVSLADLRAFMRAAIIRYMPKVDEHGRVIDIIALESDDDIQPLDNAVVLMAGGKGMRLRPLTTNVPKPLLKLGATPILERTINQFVAQGFRRFYISINYLGHLIKEYFGDGSQWGVEIKYLTEDTALGTAGSLSLLEPQSHPIVVMNGDIITRTNVRAMINLCRDGVMGIIGIREYAYTVPFGCVDLLGDRILGIDEKPAFRHFINTGIYVLAPKALNYIPSQQYFNMTDAFTQMAKDGELIKPFYITEEWIDIGSQEDYHWAQQLYGADPNTVSDPTQLHQRNRAAA